MTREQKVRKVAGEVFLAVWMVGGLLLVLVVFAATSAGDGGWFYWVSLVVGVFAVMGVGEVGLGLRRVIRGEQGPVVKAEPFQRFAGASWVPEQGPEWGADGER